MVRELPNTILEHARQLADESPWIWLFEIQVPTDPPTRYRITNAHAPVSFGVNSAGTALTYTPYPIVHGGIAEDGEGNLPTIKVQVGAASLELSAVLDAHGGLEGQPCVVRLVNQADLADSAAQVRFDGVVVECTVTADRIDLTIGSYDLTKLQAPGRRYMREYCRFRYGGPECGYDLTNSSLATAFPSCQKTRAACVAHGQAEDDAGVEILHPRRFGGFPGIPRRRA